MSLGTILLIVLILMLLGVVPTRRLLLAPPEKLMQPTTPGGLLAHRATLARPPADWPSSTMRSALAQGCWRTQSSAWRWALAAVWAARAGLALRMHWPVLV